MSGLNSTTQSIGLGSVLSGTSGSGSSGSASSSATPTTTRRQRTRCRASSAQRPRPWAACSEGSWPHPLARDAVHSRPDSGVEPGPRARLMPQRETPPAPGWCAPGTSGVSDQVQLSRRQRPRRRSRPSDRSPRRGPCWRSADGLPASPSCSWPSATGCGWMRPGRRCHS